jgi:hypothetical protein
VFHPLLSKQKKIEVEKVRYFTVIIRYTKKIVCYLAAFAKNGKQSSKPIRQAGAFFSTSPDH